jgi:hypothetical protein
MMRIPEIRNALEELGRHGKNNRRIAEIAQAWVQGGSIEEIAKRYFARSGGRDLTETE